MEFNEINIRAFEFDIRAMSKLNSKRILFNRSENLINNKSRCEPDPFNKCKFMLVKLVFFNILIFKCFNGENED